MTMQGLKKKVRAVKQLIKKIGFIFFVSDYKSAIRRLKNYLFKKPPLVAGPCNVSIGVFNGCNYKCIYCFEHSPLQIENQRETNGAYLRAKMSLSTFKKLIDDITALGYASICIPGRVGEPALNPDLIEMCRYVKNKGHRCYVTSNGLFVSNEIAESLVEIGVEELYFSVGATKAETYHRLTGASPAMFKKVLETIKNIVRYKKQKNKLLPKIFITNVICNINYREVVDMIKVALEAGVDSVGFYKMYFCDKRKPLIENLLLDKKQLNDFEKLLLKAVVLAKEYRMETNVVFMLRLLRHELLNNPIDYRINASKITSGCNILADGSVYAADYPEVLGNINKDSFITIWHSNKYAQIRNNASAIVKRIGSLPCNAFCRCCNEPLYKNINL